MKATVLLGLALAGGAIVGQQACGQPRSHIFIARVYDSTLRCVTLSEGVDVVEGPAPSGPACPPVCINDGQGDIYVSGMCPPYPEPDTIQGPDGGFDPTCQAALLAYNCNVTCGPDGGPGVIEDPEAGKACGPGGRDAGIREASADAARE